MLRRATGLLIRKHSRPVHSFAPQYRVNLNIRNYYQAPIITQTHRTFSSALHPQSQQQQQPSSIIEKDGNIEITEFEVQRNKLFEHLQSIQESIEKYEKIVQVMSADGIVENVPDTPVQDKEALAKKIINTHLQEIALCIEKIVFIEAADFLTSSPHQEEIMEENIDEGEQESLTDEERQEMLKTLEFDEKLLEENEEEEEDVNNVNSTLFSTVIRVLKCVEKLDRKEVAGIMGSKVLNICTRLVNELEAAPKSLLSKPFFKNTCLIRFNTDFYNQLLTSFAVHGDRESVTMALTDMQERMVKANPHTYHALVRLAVTEGDYLKASKIIEYEVQCGFQPLPETMELLNEM